FRDSERFLPFYRLLKKKHPDFKADKSAMRTIYQSCFGKEAFSDSRLHNLTSDMARQVERFLAVETALGPENLPPTEMEKHLLITALSRKNAGSYFRVEAESFITKLDKQPVKGPDDWYFLYKTFELLYFNPDTPKIIADKPYLSQAVDSLLLNALSTYFRYAAEWKSRELITGPKADMPYLNAILNLPGLSTHLNQAPIARVYWEIVLALQSNYLTTTFERLVELFTKNQENIPIEDRKTMLRQIINYGIRTWADDVSVGPSLLIIYKNAIQLNILLDNGRMPHISFGNIATLCAAQKEFDFARTFIAEYSPFLEESLREPVVQLAEAILLYNMGDLDGAHRLLNNEVYKVPGNEFGARNLLLKITVDRFLMLGKEEEFLSAQLENMTQFAKSRTNMSM
ncbi:MAG TPA: hypothetical protein DCF33_17080, partial [Saprospirales bacterium]|nr:hypothetical protein [Saprospirales bacterium]